MKIYKTLCFVDFICENVNFFVYLRKEGLKFV